MSDGTVLDDGKVSKAMSLLRDETTGAIMLRNLNDLMGFAAAAVNSEILKVPGGKTQTGYGQAALQIQTGAELGLGLTASMRLLYVQPKSHRIEIYSEGALALIRADPLMTRRGQPSRCVWWKDWIVGTGESLVAKARTLRRGNPEPDEWSFSVDDARAAGLWNKKYEGGDSVWVKFAKDMMLAKVRARLGKKVYPDVLGGLWIFGDWTGTDDPDLQGAVVAGVVAPAPLPPAEPPAGPDLMLQLDGPVQETKEQAAAALEVVLGEPVQERELTHAEADAAIAAQEGQADLFSGR